VNGAPKAELDFMVRYLRMETGLFSRGWHYATLMRVQAGTPAYPAGDPYEMSEEAKAAVRERIKRELMEAGK